MPAAARVQGYETVYGYQLLAHTVHDFGDAMTDGAMGKAVFNHLFHQ